MPTKEQIINNLREYSAADIVKAIKCGEVSLYELSKSGKLTPLMRKRIEEQMSASDEINGVIQANDSSDEVTATDNQDEVADDVTSTVENIEVENIEVETPSVAATIAPLAYETGSESSEGYELIDNRGMFKRVFSFKGRIRRTEYGLSYIFFMIWYGLFSAATATNGDINPVLALVVLLSIVPAYWFLWAQGAKRCHDRGNSGWYQIIPFYFFVMLFGGSDEGINDYGTSPKE